MQASEWEVDAAVRLLGAFHTVKANQLDNLIQARNTYLVPFSVKIYYCRIPTRDRSQHTDVILYTPRSSNLSVGEDDFTQIPAARW